MYTLDEGKDYLRKNWQRGVKCPCCAQMVKLYSRPMHATMARMLVELYKLDYHERDQYFHVTKISKNLGYTPTSVGDFAKLRYWGLITPKDNTDDKKRSSGMWAITAKGRQFALNQVSVPSKILLYDGRLQGNEGDPIGIEAALTSQFSYRQIMGELMPAPGQQPSLFEQGGAA